MRIDLHNHTPLCQHATGTPEEYIQKAIALGIDVYGFSCHAPMAFDTKYRMSLAQLPEYFETLQSLRQSYKTRIDIRIGLEVDFIKGKENLIESQVRNAQVDYLIGSVHFLNNWGFDNPEFIGHYKHTDMTQCWSDYLDSITMSSQSSQECIDCQIATGCGWCSAYNYEATGDVNKRITNICNAHKARVLATIYYKNKQYL